MATREINNINSRSTVSVPANRRVIMKKQLVFHEKFYNEYTFDPAAKVGRMESIMKEFSDFEVLTPSPALEEDILLVHTEDHLMRVKNDLDEDYPIALLAVGGALLAVDIARKNNQPMFAAIRPPGHHASPNGYWGFCYFNNLAIAIRRAALKNTIIIDFDLHFGDGSNNTFVNDTNVTYYACEGRTSESLISNMEQFLSQQKDVGLLAVSAGFDRHLDDWGGLLSTEDYFTIGKILKSFDENSGSNCRFACLEGGYNHDVLGKNARAFTDGFY